MYRLALILLPAAFLHAEVSLSPLFGSHAVLQAGDRVAVWGAADEGDLVTVRFAGRSATGTAVAGRWMVRLDGLTPGTIGDLVVEGRSTVTAHDVLVGDVWLCSGQSNMEMRLGPQPFRKPVEGADAAIAAADRPTMRFFVVQRATGLTPLTTVSGSWEVVSPETVKRCSAVGFAFGRAVQDARREPIGLVINAWGGSSAESWTSREALTAVPAFTGMVAWFDRQVAGYPALLASYKAEEPRLLEDWQRTAKEAKEAGKPVPEKPKPPVDPLWHQMRPTCRFNGMLAPLIPLSLRGVIWYQGESNNDRAEEYRTLLPTMIADWRARWQRPDLPFLMVEIAPFHVAKPEFREAQMHIATTVPGVDLVTTVDVGDAQDIHPARKLPVGERLAQVARRAVYGEQVVASGPRFAAATFTDGKAVVTFTGGDGGLQARGGAPLRGFSVAGPDGVFVPAEASIVGGTVEVRAAAVPSPVAVRHGWAAVPDTNLGNGAGWPAFPFRSDR